MTDQAPEQLSFRAKTLRKLSETFKVSAPEEFLDDPHFWYLVTREYFAQRKGTPTILGLKTIREGAGANLDKFRKLAITNAVNYAANYISLEKKAAFDGLTGAFNRAALDKYLLDLLGHRRSGKADVVVMFDVDHFKSINDNYSHTVGDQVLQQLVALIGGNIRGVDFLARYGGEEFVLVLPGVETNFPGWKEKILERVGSLRNEIETGLKGRVEAKVGKVFKDPITASFGVMIVDSSLRIANPEELVEKVYSPVDQALYQAKKEGRNKVCCVDG